MAMELQIFSPKPEQKFPTIKWNNEELKQEIAAAVSDYQNIVVTPETEKDSKALRARLNKLRTAIETARKDMKGRVMEPLKLFEAQVKEVEQPIDTAISNLDEQLAEIKEMKQTQKRSEIATRFAHGDYPDWLQLEQIWDEKWLNASVSIEQVFKQIDEKVRVIDGNMQTIKALPEFAYEAEEFYRQSLDFGEAVRKAKEMSEIAKRKAQAEADKTMPAELQNGDGEVAADTPLKVERIGTPVEPPKTPVNGTEQVQAKVYTFRFEVSLTAAQAAAMGAWCKEQGITLTRIQ